jgi:hypothetical protein
MIPVAEAARRLGISPKRLRNLMAGPHAVYVRGREWFKGPNGVRFSWRAVELHLQREGMAPLTQPRRRRA